MKPTLLTKYQHPHPAGIRVFDPGRNLNQHAGANVIDPAVNCKATAPGKDIVGANEAPTDHKGVVPGFGFNVEHLNILLLHWTE
jgi:hypothetical protein